MKSTCALTVSFSFLLLSCSGFAAKKSGGNKKSSNKRPTRTTAASNRGFGVAPPTFQETLASFQSRLPSNAESQNCPCHTSAEKTYAECCGPLHNGSILPATPLDVLKSRYTAFCWRNIEYIIESTHSSCRDYQDDRIAWAKSLDKNGMFDSYEFVSLHVLHDDEWQHDDSDNDDTEAFIEFQVKLRSKETGQETTVQEVSKFRKENGKWTYASGDVRSTVNGVDDIILNQ